MVTNTTWEVHGLEVTILLMVALDMDNKLLGLERMELGLILLNKQK